MSESPETLERDLVVAHNELVGIGMKASRNSNKYERLYGIAYQNLVKSGLRPQLRKKYRP